MGAINYPEVKLALDEEGNPVEVVQSATGKALVQDDDIKSLLVAILGKLESIDEQLNKIND